MVLLLVQLLVLVLVVAFILKWVTGAPCEAWCDEKQSESRFYAHALDDLENTEKQGLLSRKDAAEAHLELARQMLGAEQTITAPMVRRHVFRSAVRHIGLPFFIVLVPLMSWGVYTLLGTPQLPQRAFAAWQARDPVGLDSLEMLVRLEVEAYRHPRDGVLQERLGNAYMAAGLFQKAVNTYGRARGFLGDNARLLVLYSIALTGYNGGIVNEEAEKNLRRALELEADNADAVVGLAAVMRQNGRIDEAIDLLQNFLHDFPDTGAHEMITARLAALQQEPEKQVHMRVIRENIDKFIANAESRPQDVKVWKMLVTAWLVLEKPAEAQAAVIKAMQVLPETRAQELAVFAKARGLFLQSKGDRDDTAD